MGPVTAMKVATILCSVLTITFIGFCTAGSGPFSWAARNPEVQAARIIQALEESLPEIHRAERIVRETDREPEVAESPEVTESSAKDRDMDLIIKEMKNAIWSQMAEQKPVIYRGSRGNYVPSYLNLFFHDKGRYV